MAEPYDVEHLTARMSATSLNLHPLNKVYCTPTYSEEHSISSVMFLQRKVSPNSKLILRIALEQAFMDFHKKCTENKCSTGDQRTECVRNNIAWSTSVNLGVVVTDLEYVSSSTFRKGSLNIQCVSWKARYGMIK